MKNQRLQIKDLSVAVEGRVLVDRFSLTLPKGELHGLMGPNGSGKTSLAYALAGHPSYRIAQGTVTMDGADLLSMRPDERAKAGLFLSFQHPPFFEGITVAHFLRTAINAVKGTQLDAVEFRPILLKKMRDLGVNEEFRKRPLNQGFSGGEKKRMEVLQLSLLEPSYAILDETDSGLDLDAIQIIAQILCKLQKEHGMGVLMITHNPSIFELIRPTAVHVMREGSIVQSGGMDLLKHIRQHGYGENKTSTT